MYFYIYFFTILYNVFLSNGKNDTNRDPTISDIAEGLMTTLFNNDDKNYTKRIKILKDKLSQINSYIQDGDKYAELIMNTSKQNDLNETNFYNALIGQDHFRLLNNTKSLYLALKEKMNRDDLLQILSERGKSKMKNSARRMISENYMLKKQREEDLAETVDKYLSAVAADDHTFDDTMKYSNMWDPKGELEERKAYHDPSRRLYKGERTHIRRYPFVVSIHVMGRFWCGGSLYWQDLVITSAACLQLMHNNRYYRESPKAVSVRVGSNHSQFGGEVIDAHEVFFHPAYNPKTLNNNIAVIRLKRHVHLDHYRVPKLIDITHSTEGIPFTAEVLLLGWGVTTASGKFPLEPMFLQKKLLPIYPPKSCAEIYGEKFNHRTMFCASTITTGEGACSHDAGGPAVFNGKLVGIISYGPTMCGVPDAPTVLTLVGFYADWIETINETIPGYYRYHTRTTTTTPNTIDMLFENWKRTQFRTDDNILRTNNNTDTDEDLSTDDDDTQKVPDSPMKEEDTPEMDLLSAITINTVLPKPFDQLSEGHRENLENKLKYSQDKLITDIHKDDAIGYANKLKLIEEKKTDNVEKKSIRSNPDIKYEVVKQVTTSKTYKKYDIPNSIYRTNKTFQNSEKLNINRVPSKDRTTKPVVTDTKLDNLSLNQLDNEYVMQSRNYNERKEEYKLNIYTPKDSDSTTTNSDLFETDNPQKIETGNNYEIIDYAQTTPDDEVIKKKSDMSSSDENEQHIIV